MSPLEIALIATVVSFLFGMTFRESCFWWAMFVSCSFFAGLLYGGAL